MEVKKITSVEEIISILSLKDERLEKQVLQRLECTKAEWVQWIVKMLTFNDGNSLKVWATSDELKKIKAYIIAMNAVSPPISKSVLILYQNYFGIKDDDGVLYLEKALICVEEWGKELGANKIIIQTNYPRINSKLGFILEDGVSMFKRLC